jgi:hypothetical protein
MKSYLPLPGESAREFTKTAAALTPNQCIAIDCAAFANHAAGQILCPDHWNRLPDHLQHEVSRAYSPGQGADPSLASPEFALAVVRSSNYLAVAERRMHRDDARERERKVRMVVESYRKERERRAKIEEAEKGRAGEAPPLGG